MHMLRCCLFWYEKNGILLLAAANCSHHRGALVPAISLKKDLENCSAVSLRSRFSQPFLYNEIVQCVALMEGLEKDFPD